MGGANPRAEKHGTEWEEREGWEERGRDGRCEEERWKEREERGVTYESLIVSPRLDIPRSVITTLSLSRKMFFVFRSLCTMLRACRYPKPWAT